MPNMSDLKMLRIGEDGCKNRLVRKSIYPSWLISLKRQTLQVSLSISKQFTRPQVRLCKAVINNMRVILADSRFGIARSEMATLMLQPADDIGLLVRVVFGIFQDNQRLRMRVSFV